MEKIWLPPIEICCKDIKISFILAENFENHMFIECEKHGNKFFPNPLTYSRFRIKFLPSKGLKKRMLEHMSKREKRIKRFIIKDNKRQTSPILSGKIATLF